MYYEINISKKNNKGDYVHFFATAERSITSEEHLVNVYDKLNECFPSPEYKLTVTNWRSTGSNVNILSLKERKNKK